MTRRLNVFNTTIVKLAIVQHLIKLGEAVLTSWSCSAARVNTLIQFNRESKSDVFLQAFFFLIIYISNLIHWLLMNSSKYAVAELIIHPPLSAWDPASLL